MAYINTACAGCVTIFSNVKFYPVSKLHTLTLATHSYELLLLLLLAKVYTFENFTTTLCSAQHGLCASPVPMSLGLSIAYHDGADESWYQEEHAHDSTE